MSHTEPELRVLFKRLSPQGINDRISRWAAWGGVRERVVREAEQPPPGPSCLSQGTWGCLGGEEAGSLSQGISTDQKGQEWGWGAGAGRIWKCRFPLRLTFGFRILFEVNESEVWKQVKGLG